MQPYAHAWELAYKCVNVCQVKLKREKIKLKLKTKIQKNSN